VGDARSRAQDCGLAAGAARSGRRHEAGTGAGGLRPSRGAGGLGREAAAGARAPPPRRRGVEPERGAGATPLPPPWPPGPPAPSPQVDYLLSGIFSRACKALGGASERVDEIAAEAGQLRGLLADKLLLVLVNLEGEAAHWGWRLGD
jgi:hypothetical protein